MASTSSKTAGHLDRFRPPLPPRLSVLGTFFACARSLSPKDFFPAEDTYDLVWIQWVVGHFTDVDFLKVLKRCRAALREGGVVVVKDNVVAEGDGAFKVDSEDSSMTRSLAYFRSLFSHAGVRVVHQVQQDGFPGELFPVYMFALE